MLTDYEQHVAQSCIAIWKYADTNITNALNITSTMLFIRQS